MKVEGIKELYLPTHKFVIDLLPDREEKDDHLYLWEGKLDRNGLAISIELRAFEAGGLHLDGWSLVSLKTAHGIEAWEFMQLGDSGLVVFLRQMILHSATELTEIDASDQLLVLRDKLIANLPFINPKAQSELIRSSDIDIAASGIFENPVFKTSQRLVDRFVGLTTSILRG